MAAMAERRRAASPSPRPDAQVNRETTGEQPCANGEAAATSKADNSGSVTKRAQRSVFLIYFLVVLYALCYQLQSPLEPFLIERLIGKDKNSDLATSFGRLQSFFSVVQMVGSLLIGYILDRWGAKVGFVINFLGCALVYLLLANTSSIEMLYLSKVPGVAMAGFLCAQTAISQITPAGPERIVALGRLTTAYTIGGVVGPYCGGILGSQGDYYLSAKVAVVGSVFAAGLCFFLPATAVKVSTNTEKSSQTVPSPAQLPWVGRVKMILRLAGFLILVKLITGTANSMASSTQSLILKSELGFSEADMGRFMSAQFAFGGFANAFLLAPIMNFLGDKARSVVHKCIAIMACGYLLQAGFNSVLASFPWRHHVFIGVAMLLSLFQYSLSTSITAENTQIVPDSMKGTLIGMEHCIFSGARILTPAIGTSILSSGGVGALYCCCAFIFFSVLALWLVLAPKMLPQEQKQKNG